MKLYLSKFKALLSDRVKNALHEYRVTVNGIQLDTEDFANYLGMFTPINPGNLTMEQIDARDLILNIFNDPEYEVTMNSSSQYIILTYKTYIP